MTETKALVKVGTDDWGLMIDSPFSDKQVAALSKPTPTKYIKRKTGRGGKTFDYVDVHYVEGVLNAITGFDWDDEVMKEIIDWGHMQVVVHVRLTVRTKEGRQIIKHGYGGSDIKVTIGRGEVISLADDLKSAHSDALKKAASKLGVAWDVYAGLAKADENTPISGQEKRESRNVGHRRNPNRDKVARPDQAQEAEGATSRRRKVRRERPPSRSGSERRKARAARPKERQAPPEVRKLANKIKELITGSGLDAKDFKAFLYGLQEENEAFKKYKFVGENNFGYLAFHEGNIDSLNQVINNFEWFYKHYQIITGGKNAETKTEE